MHPLHTAFQISRSRELRRGSTPAESLLWYRLRARRLAEFKFRRQHPVGPFIVDFVCLERALVVEVDGGHHQLVGEYDGRRTEALTGLGFQLLRFWNNEILGDLESVTQTILLELKREEPPSP